MLRNLYRHWVDRLTGRPRRRGRGKPLRLESLEHRNLMAAGLVFQGPLRLAAGDETSAVISADFNADGFLDVVVADRQSSQVSVLLAAGDGTFHDRLHFDAERPARSLTTADVDGDGDPDLLIAGGEGPQAGFSVLRNDGTGSDGWQGLETVSGYATGQRPASVVAGDFDGDGYADVAVANASDVSVRAGYGDATFADPIGYLPGAGFRSLAVGDLNSDGHLDLAVTNGNSAQVSILLGAGDGTFEPHDQVYALGTPGQRGAWPLAVADWDGDGRLDLAVVRDDSYEGNVAILRGNGDGSFGPQPVLSTLVGTTASIAGGDIDDDGDLDLIVAHGGVFHNPDYGNAPGGLTVLPGNGDGSFGSPIRLVTDEGKQTVHVADIDGDHRLDILADGQRGALLLQATGDTMFEPELTTFAAGARAYWATVGDLDDDGDVDLAVANQDSADVSVLLGNGAAQFTPGQSPSVGVGPVRQIAADLSADGQLDLAVVNGGSNDVSILIGTGNGSFRPQLRYKVGSAPNSLVAVDVNGDAILDLAVANSDSNSLSVLLGQGDTAFAEPVRVDVGEAPQSVIAGDLDADGHADLVVANRWSGQVSVLRGNGDGTFQAKVQYPVGEDPVAVAWADLDADGHVDLAVARGYTKTITVLPGDGDGTFDLAARAEYAVADYPTSLAVADVNGDDTADLISGNGETDGICRTVCLGGGISVLAGRAGGGFDPAENYHFARTDFRSVTTQDLDGDGDQDLVLANALGANVLRNDMGHGFTPQAGDANVDGKFDQFDIMQVLQADKYKSGQPATFAEGDWNGDGRFDQLDIVAALQTGNYLQGPYTSFMPRGSTQ